MSELYDREKNALESLREWVIENPDENEPHDTIAEIADSNVPIYTGNILQCALDNLWLATEEPELGPAFDGTATPINIIAANIYEYLTEKLWEEWSSIEDEKRDIRYGELDAVFTPDPESVKYRYNDGTQMGYRVECFGVDTFYSDFWSAFTGVVKIAEGLEAETLTISWNITEQHVEETAKYRKERADSESDSLIAKQASRSTRVDKPSESA